MPILKDQIPGGKADGKDLTNYQVKQLLKGILVELEHTDDVGLALEISTDHLQESDTYYDSLEEMEKNMEKEGKDFMNLETGDGISDYVENEILQFAPPEVVDELKTKYGDLTKLSMDEIIDLLDDLLDGPVTGTVNKSANIFSRYY